MKHNGRNKETEMTENKEYTIEECMDKYFKTWRGVMINDGEINGFDEESKNIDLHTPYSDCLHWM